MLKKYESPLQKVIKQHDYQKHLQRIDHILSRNKTADFYLQTSQDRRRHNFGPNIIRKAEIQASNDKIYRKLQQIKGRKSRSFNVKSQSDRSHTNSPFQKKQLRRIQLENMKLIKRMISMKCINNHQKIKKDVEQYQRIKGLLKSNKSIRFPNFKTPIDESCRILT